MQAANTYMMRCSRLQFVILTVRRVVLRVRRPLQIGLFVCKHQASLQPEESCLPFARPAFALDAEHRATTLLKQLHEAKAAARFSDLNWRCCIWRLGVVLGCLICVGARVAVVLTCVGWVRCLQFAAILVASTPRQASRSTQALQPPSSLAAAPVTRPKYQSHCCCPCRHMPLWPIALHP